MQVNKVDLAVSISGHGPPLVWGHGMLASMAAEDPVPRFAWERLFDVAMVIHTPVVESQWGQFSALLPTMFLDGMKASSLT